MSGFGLSERCELVYNSRERENLDRPLRRWNPDLQRLETSIQPRESPRSPVFSTDSSPHSRGHERHVCRPSSADRGPTAPRIKLNIHKDYGEPSNKGPPPISPPPLKRHSGADDREPPLRSRPASFYSNSLFQGDSYRPNYETPRPTVSIRETRDTAPDRALSKAFASSSGCVSGEQGLRIRGMASNPRAVLTTATPAASPSFDRMVNVEACRQDKNVAAPHASNKDPKTDFSHAHQLSRLAVASSSVVPAFRKSGTPASEITTSSKASSLRKICRLCHEPPDFLQPLIKCQKCPRRYHKAHTEPLCRTDEDCANFVCKRCLGKTVEQKSLVESVILTPTSMEEKFETVPTGGQILGTHEKTTSLVISEEEGRSRPTQPEEAVQRLDSHATERGARDMSATQDTLPEPRVLPPTGPAVKSLPSWPVLDILLADRPRECNIKATSGGKFTSPSNSSQVDAADHNKENVYATRRQSSNHSLSPETRFQDEAISPAAEAVAKDYKQITCPWWDMGDCHHSSTGCVFAHASTRLRTPSGRESNKDWTCYFWKNSLRCVQNESAEGCFYAHYNTGRSVGIDGRACRKFQTCYYWNALGKCVKAETCPFSHNLTGYFAEDPANKPGGSNHSRPVRPAPRLLVRPLSTKVSDQHLHEPPLDQNVAVLCEPTSCRNVVDVKGSTKAFTMNEGDETDRKSMEMVTCEQLAWWSKFRWSGPIPSRVTGIPAAELRESDKQRARSSSAHSMSGIAIPPRPPNRNRQTSSTLIELSQPGAAAGNDPVKTSDPRRDRNLVCEADEEELNRNKDKQDKLSESASTLIDDETQQMKDASFVSHGAKPAKFARCNVCSKPIFGAKKCASCKSDQELVVPTVSDTLPGDADISDSAMNDLDVDDFDDTRNANNPMLTKTVKRPLASAARIIKRKAGHERVFQSNKRPRPDVNVAQICGKIRPPPNPTDLKTSLSLLPSVGEASACKESNRNNSTSTTIVEYFEKASEILDLPCTIAGVATAPVIRTTPRVPTFLPCPELKVDSGLQKFQRDITRLPTSPIYQPRASPQEVPPPSVETPQISNLDASDTEVPLIVTQNKSSYWSQTTEESEEEHLFAWEEDVPEEPKKTTAQSILSRKPSRLRKPACAECSRKHRKCEHETVVNSREVADSKQEAKADEAPSKLSWRRRKLGSDRVNEFDETFLRDGSTRSATEDTNLSLASRSSNYTDKTDTPASSVAPSFDGRGTLGEKVVYEQDLSCMEIKPLLEVKPSKVSTSTVKGGTEMSATVLNSTKEADDVNLAAAIERMKLRGIAFDSDDSDDDSEDDHLPQMSDLPRLSRNQHDNIYLPKFTYGQGMKNKNGTAVLLRAMSRNLQHHGNVHYSRQSKHQQGQVEAVFEKKILNARDRHAPPALIESNQQRTMSEFLGLPKNLQPEPCLGPGEGYARELMIRNKNVNESTTNVRRRRMKANEAWPIREQ